VRWSDFTASLRLYSRTENAKAPVAIRGGQFILDIVCIFNRTQLVRDVKFSTSDARPDGRCSSRRARLLVPMCSQAIFSRKPVLPNTLRLGISACGRNRFRRSRREVRAEK
jgi:hypothetical protein